MSLAVTDLHADIAAKPILQGLSLRIAPGEVVALIGSPGCGKSTLMRAIFGRHPVISGRVEYEGKSTLERSPAEQIRAGIAYVQQGGKVFRSLSVTENLALAAMMLPGTEASGRIGELYTLFPRLAERRGQAAGSLSGGERQMLALSMGMMTRPSLILLDEPSTGLSPLMTERILGEVRSAAKSSGAAVLVVEQNVRNAVSIGDRVLVMSRGIIAHDHAVSPDADLAELLEAYSFTSTARNT
ncbi:MULTISPECIES: ABC transporter ATP-binding protein [unclassified Chelatococcus]|uniref:ABC transporter ATP-binding protein n=1 Tax=unclassified Chelatococcus TaxID=2638111 RepID=UPI001BD0F7B4|nr:MULTISPECIES: ABC transporter ATP-binding protein [unclassified Chelatococcus]MBS7700474.1 ABC transporter ATP-binding protein [Chelatococcus sp. YT9]MBX3556270.1 ABC transporter ATP-binding protein [Chelatococcus sp.]